MWDVGSEFRFCCQDFDSMLVWVSVAAFGF